jgi:uncharacterized protein
VRRVKILWLLLAIVFFFVSYIVNKSDYPRPTDAFYVNDFANALMGATKDSIRREGERLYDVSQDEVDGGAQVVFATFLVDSIEEISGYDKTDIYREWAIGDDDMGALVILFFTQGTDELILEEVQIEVGYRMEPYLTPTVLGQAVDNSIYNEEYNWLLDIAVMKLEYEILSEIYIDAYNYESFDYDMDVFYDYLLTYTPSGEISDTSANIFLYLTSSNTPFFKKLTIVLPYIFIAMFGGSVAFIGNRGGGGSSGGMGLRRKR